MHKFPVLLGVKTRPLRFIAHISTNPLSIGPNVAMGRAIAFKMTFFIRALQFHENT